MRNFKLVLCAIAIAMTSTSVFAEGEITKGTVTFDGELTDNTCSLESAGATAIAVQLPTIQVASLAKAEDEAGSKSFDIKVVNCPASVTQVAAHFEAINSSGVNSATGNLINDYAATADKAENVEIRLYNANAKDQLKLGTTGEPAIVTDGKATLTYYGGYYATGKTTVGKVHAKTLFTLAYP